MLTPFLNAMLTDTRLVKIKVLILAVAATLAKHRKYYHDYGGVVKGREVKVSNSILLGVVVVNVVEAVMKILLDKES